MLENLSLCRFGSVKCPTFYGRTKQGGSDVGVRSSGYLWHGLVRAGFPCFRTGPTSLCRLSFSNYPNGWSVKEGRDEVSRCWFSAPCLQEDEWLITSLE